MNQGKNRVVSYGPTPLRSVPLATYHSFFPCMFHVSYYFIPVLIDSSSSTLNPVPATSPAISRPPPTPTSYVDDAMDAMDPRSGATESWCKSDRQWSGTAPSFIIFRSHRSWNVLSASIGR